MIKTLKINKFIALLVFSILAIQSVAAANFAPPSIINIAGAGSLGFASATVVRLTGGGNFYRFTGADATTYQVDTLVVNKANGVLAIHPTGITLTGVGGLQTINSDVKAAEANALGLTAADKLHFDGADSVTGYTNGNVVFNIVAPGGFDVTNFNGARFTGADMSAKDVVNLQLKSIINSIQ